MAWRGSPGKVAWTPRFGWSKAKGFPGAQARAKAKQIRDIRGKKRMNPAFSG
jgi:hypothetical protein